MLGQFKQKYFIQKTLIKRESKMIIIEQVNYMGYKQGVKVYIDGIKYPKLKNHFYCEFKNDKKAIKQALKEHKGK